MKSKCGFYVTSRGAKNKCAYLLNAEHPNHFGKEIQARQVGSRMEFELGLAEAARGDGKIRRGRKQRYSAVEFVGSTPMKCWLTDQERRMIENAVVEELDIITCLLVWHIDGRRESRDDAKGGRDDFHLITPNRDSQGRLLTARERGNLLFHFRSIMDRVHDAINQARRRAGQPHIETMSEVRAKIRGEGHAKLVMELADTDGPLTPEGVVALLKASYKLGKRCRIKGGIDDYVSVVYKVGCRGRRENLEALVQDALEKRKARRQEKADAALELLRIRWKRLRDDQGNAP